MARYERLPQLLLIIFIVMVAAASFIGWLTHATVTSVYNEALREGATTQPNPFLHAPPLNSVKNIVIYIALIGALLAIILGVQSALRDRKAKVLNMVFSRPVSRRHYLFAKLLGISIWLAVILAVSAVFTWISLWVIQGQPLSASLTGHLVVFFIISWLFLVPFISMGLMSGFIARRETTALLTPVLLWALLSFVIPQLGTAAEPISFLNPVPAQVASKGKFFRSSRQVLQPVSYINHYKQISASTLGYNNSGESWKSPSFEAAILAAGSLAVLVSLTPRAIRKDELYE